MPPAARGAVGSCGRAKSRPSPGAGGGRGRGGCRGVSACTSALGGPGPGSCGMFLGGGGGRRGRG